MNARNTNISQSKQGAGVAAMTPTAHHRKRIQNSLIQNALMEKVASGEMQFILIEVQVLHYYYFAIEENEY